MPRTARKHEHRFHPSITEMEVRNGHGPRTGIGCGPRTVIGCGPGAGTGCGPGAGTGCGPQ